MKRFRLLVLFIALPFLGCTDSKKAEAPKEFAPMPTQGPAGAAGPGGKKGGEAAPPAKLD